MSDTRAYAALISLFKFPFSGKQWQRNFLIGSIVIFAGFYIPLIPWVFILGYTLNIMKLSMKSHNLELPGWDDIGQLGIDGLRGSFVFLLYTLPGLGISFGGMGIYLFTSMIFPLIMELGRWHSQVYNLVIPGFLFINFSILFISMFLGMLLTISGAVSLPLALSHFIAKNQLAAAFHIREWLMILKKNMGGYFITWVIVAGVTMIIYTLLMLMYYSVALCCLVPFVFPPVMMYTLAIYAALFGKIYQETVNERE
jgi:hypothetical protein